MTSREPKYYLCNACRVKVLPKQEAPGLNPHMLCAKCYQWKHYTETLEGIVINGQMYLNLDDPGEENPQGRPYIIRHFAQGRMEIYNLLPYGPVPEYWRSKLPDNAEWLEY